MSDRTTPEVLHRVLDIIAEAMDTKEAVREIVRSMVLSGPYDFDPGSFVEDRRDWSKFGLSRKALLAELDSEVEEEA